MGGKLSPKWFSKLGKASLPTSATCIVVPILGAL
jgi:hypothetical protein